MRKVCYTAAALVMAFAVFYLFRSCRQGTATESTKPDTAPKIKLDKPLEPAPVSATSGRTDAEQKSIASFRAPITFYGKVIDQYGNPVAGASVELRANDRPVLKGSIYSRTTDASGLFSITGVHGLSLFAKVRKEGYYQVYSRDSQSGSEMSFAYGMNLGYGIHNPDPANPTTFHLQKGGVVENLLRRNGRFLITRDGTPRRISLHPDNSPAHVVEISCRTDDQNIAPNQKYSWHYKITVPNGELALRHSEFDFEAPVGTYQTNDEYRMTPSPEQGRWRESVERSYFIRFKDGIYARVDIEMIARGQHVVRLTSWLNPKVGSRNLEADPKQR